jgi:hypothetical protein
MEVVADRDPFELLDNSRNGEFKHEVTTGVKISMAINQLFHHFTGRHSFHGKDTWPLPSLSRVD